MTDLSFFDSLKWFESFSEDTVSIFFICVQTAKTLVCLPTSTIQRVSNDPVDQIANVYPKKWTESNLTFYKKKCQGQLMLATGNNFLFRKVSRGLLTVENVKNNGGHTSYENCLYLSNKTVQKLNPSLPERKWPLDICDALRNWRFKKTIWSVDKLST